MNLIIPSTSATDPHEFCPLDKVPPYFLSSVKAVQSQYSLVEDEFTVRSHYSSETDATTVKRSEKVKKSVPTNNSKASLASLESLQPVNASTSLATFASTSTTFAAQTIPDAYTFAIMNDSSVRPTWRLKERMKTVGVGLILALNIGTDPPDVQKPNPCAKLLCWLDPMSMSRAKARERIGERLEAQYARWQQRAKLKYKRALDPTIEDCRSLCIQLRRSAKGERVLLHYNGSGVPKPTPNGELWVFDRQHTQYIPLSTMDLVRWVGKPSIIILDCSGAGILMPFLTGTTDSSVSLNKLYEEDRGASHGLNIDSTPTSMKYSKTSQLSSTNAVVAASVSSTIHTKDMRSEQTVNRDTQDSCTIEGPISSMRDIIVLCPTSAHEALPFNPELPADLFTSCLTTPISIALRWHIHQNPLSFSNLDPESVDSIPGCLHDRKTPLGELHWIFTAVTDTIAWNVLPSHLFQRLFRQDLLVASMFRNFLLADRIFRGLNCTPISYPALPSTFDHSLWLSWDLAVETSISKLVRDGILGTSDIRPLSPKHNEGGNEDRHRDSVDDDDDDDDEGDDVDEDDHKRGGREESIMGVHHPSHAVTSNNILLGPTGSMYKVIPSAISLQVTSQYDHDASFMGTSFHSLHVMSPFFAEQLTAFEVWLDFASTRLQAGGSILSPPLKLCDLSIGTKRNLISLMYPGTSIDVEAPEQLPIVLQVLLSQAHRVRALILLQRFLDLGPSAVNLALCVGIFPYVLKLLQSPMDEYRHILVAIWSRIIDFDPSCRVDLLKDGAVTHFVKHLQWGIQRDPMIDPTACDNHSTMSDQEQDAARQRIMAAKILSAICRGYPQGQMECLRKNLHGVCCMLLKESDIGNDISNMPRFSPEYRVWLCLCIGCLVDHNAHARFEASKLDIHARLFDRMNDDCADVRASAMHALASFLASDDFSKMHPIVSNIDSLSHLPQQFTSSKNSYLMNPPHVHTSGLLGLLHENKLNSSNQTLHRLGPSNAFHQQPSIFNMNPFHQQKGIIEATPERIPVHLEIDCEILRIILVGVNDASSVVRYEAVVALAVAVEKYMTNFEGIVDRMLKKGHDNEQYTLAIHRSNMKEFENEPIPCTDFSRDTQVFDMLLGDVWKCLRSLQHFDPHPVVCKAATSIVSLLYDHVLMKQLQSDNGQLKESQPTTITEQVAKVQEGSHHHISRVSSDLTMTPLAHPSPPLFRRHQSDLRLENINTEKINSLQPTNRFNHSGDGYKIDFSFPVSQFFSWKNLNFHRRSTNLSAFDPLSKEGSIKVYRDERNFVLQARRSYLMDHFSVLNPKDVKQTLSKDGFEAPVDLFGFQDDDKENEAAITAEATSRKKELYFNESCLLSSRVCESKRTSVLRFHLCEPILASCDENNNLTIWDVSSVGRRLQSFQNSNQADSRITSLSWINELSNSLLLTGCDDGSIRLWSGVLDDYTGNSFERPTLANSFFAMPELHPGQKGSGLVTEWQQSHGRLIVGGDCPRIRCWDIEAEKCRNIIESDMNACLTSITSTWDSFQLSTQYRADGSSGLGPDIIVAGYSDGTIRAYDLRIPNACPVSEIKSDPRSRLRERWMKQVRFAEHSNWVVNVSFRKCGSRHEIVSGSTAGDIKFWDLRLPNSIRTLEIQRSPMTALACHTSIPLLASGSQAQFIKLMTPDGDITQVIRYHEKVSNQMIGPVSCLTFHPTQPLLAVGSTDEYIGLYKANISY